MLQVLVQLLDNNPLMEILSEKLVKAQIISKIYEFVAFHHFSQLSLKDFCQLLKFC